MAVRSVPFPVVYSQNQNSYSQAYGKYYAEPYSVETLSLRGLIERVAFDQSVYSTDIVEGVITKLTTVMVELLKSGQPVKWDGLGTFTPTVENRKGGASEAELKAGISVTEVIEGVHIRFVPENSKGDEITSRKLKDMITFSVEGVKVLTTVGQDKHGKPIQKPSVLSMEVWAKPADPDPDPEP